MTVLLSPSDFARLVGWGTSRKAVRRANQWLKRHGIGSALSSGRRVWTIAELEAKEPGLHLSLQTSNRLEDTA